MFREMKRNRDGNRKRAIREDREGMITDGSEVWGLERNKLVEYLRYLSSEALTKSGCAECPAGSHDLRFGAGGGI
jgi:hypothetical protein